MLSKTYMTVQQTNTWLFSTSTTTSECKQWNRDKYEGTNQNSLTILKICPRVVSLILIATGNTQQHLASKVYGPCIINNITTLHVMYEGTLNLCWSAPTQRLMAKACHSEHDDLLPMPIWPLPNSTFMYSWWPFRRGRSPITVLNSYWSIGYLLHSEVLS